ncbi:hypothetical protein FYJ45_08315 [Eisenbergiella tayi]|uniref:Uncharacterized protein n=2 Tax=Lachnospiraceae TaxID=186803 RepID=A0A6N7WF31_9FIRM|nr:hypothetical protein [Eisenbergiella massiliensis]MSS88294.1 hypothetical protein [Eisenbergiella porci]
MGNSLGGFDTLFMPVGRTDAQAANAYVKKPIGIPEPLKFPAYIVGAFYEDKLVGLIRAMFDGLSADIREFCLECELQGDNLKYNNGSVIEQDKYGIAGRMGNLLTEELRKLGNTFTVAYIVKGTEEDIYRSIGLKHNQGHAVYYRDERPYV